MECPLELFKLACSKLLLRDLGAFKNGTHVFKIGPVVDVCSMPGKQCAGGHVLFFQAVPSGLWDLSSPTRD